MKAMTSKKTCNACNGSGKIGVLYGNEGDVKTIQCPCCKSEAAGSDRKIKCSHSKGYHTFSSEDKEGNIVDLYWCCNCGGIREHRYRRGCFSSRSHVKSYPWKLPKLVRGVK